MYDIRYPNLELVGDGGFGVGGCPVPGLDAFAEKVVRRIAKAVSSRVHGVRVAYQRNRGCAFFHYRTPDGYLVGVLSRRVYDGAGFVCMREEHADEIVREIQSAKASPAVKERMERIAAEREEEAARRDKERVQSDAAREAGSRLMHRLGHRKVISA